MLKVKKVIRGVKESVLDYDDVQRRIRAATSNDPVGPDSRELSRLAHDTHNRVSYNSLFTIFWKRLTDLQQPSHIVKALIVCEYLLVHGNERFVRDMRSRQRVLKRLTGYVFYRNHEDVGAEVRQRSREVLKLTLSDELLESRRKEVAMAVNKGEPQRYERAYGGEYMQSPRQQQLVQHQQDYEDSGTHSFDAKFADDPLSSSRSFSEYSDHHQQRQQRQQQRQLAASPFDDPAFEEVTHQRKQSASAKKSKHDKEKKKKKKERSTREKASRKKKNVDTGRQKAPAADFDEEEEEDMRTRQLRRAMAGVDVFAPSEYEPSSADVSQAPVDFLTGDNANVISTNWVSDMDFSRAQPPEADASAFFQTSTSDGLGTVEQDGFAFDDALEIDSDDALDGNANTGTSFWESHGSLTDVSDLRANEYTAKKASVAPAKKRGALTLQQIAQKNAVEEANTLTIRPAAGTAVPYAVPSPHAQIQHQPPFQTQPQLQLQQQPYQQQQQQMYSGALMPYGAAPPMQQQQQQYGMLPYPQLQPPMAYGAAATGYGMGMVPALGAPSPMQPPPQQQQQQMDPFNSLGRKGSSNMWQHM